MKRQVATLGIVLLVSVALLVSAAAQTPTQTGSLDEGFTLSLPVNEISLTFHVSDAQGVPVANLSQDNVKLFDNGEPQTRIVDFQAYHDLPVRAGILMDTSISMETSVAHNVEVATEYLARYFRRETDRAFVMRFDVETHLERDWSGNPGILADGLQAAAYETGKGPDGTAVFDSIYKACRDQWPADSGTVTGNFILLFTDGIDNASRAHMPDVIDRCQRSRAAIYVFLNEWKTRGSRGQETLDELVAKSGGRIFYIAKDEQMERDLATMENDMRNQYRMVYKFPELKRNGSFHRIKLECLVKRCEVLARSGYYAATRR
jgi:Ca-activated chloride channel homolog